MARQYKVLREGGTEDGNINSQITALQQEVAARGGKDFCVGDPGITVIASVMAGHFYTYVAVTCSWKEPDDGFSGD